MDAAQQGLEVTGSSQLPRPEVPRRPGMRLTVVMAAHNEARTIEEAVRRVLAVRGPFELELIVVDDGSTDDTLRRARAVEDPRLTVLSHPSQRGKGAAVLSAAAVATGTHVLVFDADLEYSPSDIPSLVEPILEGTAEVVYGARVAGFHTAYQSYRFRLGAGLTTGFANLVFDAGLTDMHTCLKLVPMALFRQLTLTERGFGLDTELTGELLRRGVRPFEIPCTYHGRSRAAGKEISLRDGWECLKVVVRVRRRGLLEPWVTQRAETVQRAETANGAKMSVVAQAAVAPAVAGGTSYEGRAPTSDHAA